MNQDKDVQITEAELRKAMECEMATLMKEVRDAMNNARDGAIIKDSEGPVREAVARFREKLYQKAAQIKADKAAKAAFSPSSHARGVLPRDKGMQGVNHTTSNGTIRIERRIYWYAGEGTDSRLDRWLGIADASLSVAARELCCLVGVDSGFRKAAAKLKKLGQIEISASVCGLWSRAKDWACLMRSVGRCSCPIGMRRTARLAPTGLRRC